MYQWRKQTAEEKIYARKIAKLAGVKYIEDVDLKKLNITDPTAFIDSGDEMKVALNDELTKCVEKLKKLSVKSTERTLYFEFNGLMFIKLDIKNSKSNTVVVANMYWDNVK